VLRFEQALIRQGEFELRADFAVPAGETCAVIGPSGAGKSTLLGAIGGFLPVNEGAIWWDQTEITHAAPGDRPLAMLFQDNNLFPHLSVRQNVGLGLRPNLRLAASDHKRIEAAISRVGLAGMEDRKPGSLSGGQQSRAALARILVQHKPLLLLDEPFAALGPAMRQEMLDLVAELVSETDATLLMVTHAPEDVARIADEVVFVEDGKADAPAPAAELMNNPPPALRAYLG
jgi:thiamine transport system ATP-binding protein